MKGLMMVGAITIAAAIGAKQICTYVKHHKIEITELKRIAYRWQDLFYDQLTQDDVAWG